MKEFRFKAWDKNKNEMIANFTIAPTQPNWGAFPIEHVEWLSEYQRIINDKIGIQLPPAEAKWLEP